MLRQLSNWMRIVLNDFIKLFVEEYFLAASWVAVTGPWTIDPFGESFRMLGAGGSSGGESADIP